MTWRDKTCEDCVFRVDRYCRRFPPSPDASYSYPAYTVVAVHMGHKDNPWFESACAEHATELQQLTIKDVVR